ncbi:hypothetical protein [Sphingomonas turrisvirgatae]|uniref:Uncharacterized protein n=1 Tax=Sphingomonas turrisvirgatae TaxID=1888892 RepID=A0A1E3LVL5_9SPHN|nr:hypothetical protein [Sphingomonas turrisvirgatae]ODP37783.1 hypothetical protein BFL28_02110 [Sphingomonas turrisvirgatae]
MILLTITAFAAAAQPAPEAKKAEDAVVCKNRIPSGTRFAKRVCRKQSEIDAQAERDRRLMDELQGGPKMNPDEGPPRPQ